jgi:hypothetical protein
VNNEKCGKRDGLNGYNMPVWKVPEKLLNSKNAQLIQGF